jgi:hypothetical protein
VTPSPAARIIREPPWCRGKRQMLGSFWDSVAGKLADRWFALSGQALVFWAGALLAWAAANGGIRSLEGPGHRLAGYSGPGQVAVLVGALLLVAASAIVVQRLTGPVLSLLEGYWPRLLHPLQDTLIGRCARRADTARREVQKLAGPVHDGTATRKERDRYVRLDRRLRRMPTRDRLLPTPIGNTLRAAETRPVDKYGLDPVSLWPHLWLLMPDTARQELAAARAALDASVAAVVWGLLFLAFTPWSPWAPPVGLGVAALALLVWIPARAANFAALVEAAFDLYRQNLYTQLRWPLPASPHDERREGRRVTTYLLRGSDAATPLFTGQLAPGPPPLPQPESGQQAQQAIHNQPS